VRKIVTTIGTLVVLVATSLHAQAGGASFTASVDSIARDVLERTGVPSASVAVVQDGHIVYAQAYGAATLEPRVAATTTMRYSIGSISKQFTAASILMLQQQGKLSLDEKVARYLPDLTRADEVTIRQLLSHTSGYQDYWPQDYVPRMMLEPVTAQQIMDRWAKKPLDFDPGTRWQYSNTNYVIAGTIVEKVSGEAFFDFVREHILEPLHMTSVANVDVGLLTQSDPTGYMRYALGPLHPAPKEGKGWLFAMAELAMTPSDLAKWDIAMIEESLLAPASYKEMEREVLLKNGVGTGYGLGVDVGMMNGHRAISHGGEVSGFTAENIVFPDDHAAVVVLTNQDAARASGAIANGIAGLLFGAEDTQTARRTAQARTIFEGLQHGVFDRFQFTPDAVFYFSDQAIRDFASSLAPFGAPTDFVQVSQGLRGGMVLRVFRATFANGRALRIWTFQVPDGRLEQYQVAVPN